MNAPADWPAPASNRHMALWRPAAAVGGAEGLVAYGKGHFARTRAKASGGSQRKWLCLLGMRGILGPAGAARMEAPRTQSECCLDQ